MNNESLKLEKIDKENIEICRPLCDELMAYQASKAVNFKSVFKAMNFDTRMKPSYDTAADALVIAAKDKEAPIGYIFASVEDITQESLIINSQSLPFWAKEIYESNPNMSGMYPAWITPQKIGHINNLYIKPDYRKFGLGGQMMTLALNWIQSHEFINYIFVHVSNGNTDAAAFYEKHGFIYSHDVYSGFIYGYYKKINSLSVHKTT